MPKQNKQYERKVCQNGSLFNFVVCLLLCVEPLRNCVLYTQRNY